MFTTTTLLLNGTTLSGSLAVTNANVNAGFATAPTSAQIPVYIGPANGNQNGIYITPSVGCEFGFTLQAHLSGYRSGGANALQTLFSMDQTGLLFASAAPIANLTGADAIIGALTNYSAGSLTISVVQ